MSATPGAARGLFVTSLLLLAVHITLLVVNPHATSLSNLFSLLFLLMGVVVCLLGAFREPAETRPLWLFFGCGLLLAAVGQFGFAYYYYTTHLFSQAYAIHFDFFFFAYGIPILLAICSRSRDVGLKTFAWLDGAQALIAAMLAYLQLFTVLPSHGHVEAISASTLNYLDDAENWILVAAVTLRFFSNPSPARKRFYHVLGTFLWVNIVVVSVIGYLEMQLGWSFGLQDALWGLPEVALLGAFALQSRATPEQPQPASESTFGLLIDNLSPLLFTLVITLMAVKIAPEYQWLRFVCISAAVAIYGVRAAILQVRYAQSQEELTRAIVATEQASLAKSQFLANMSHEIRTPMNGILGMTELALSTRLTEEQRDFLMTVKSSADRLLVIINEILDYSKMEAGKTVLDSVAFHLPDVVRDVSRSLAFLAHQKNLELALHIAPDVPADLTGDPVRLAQVLINLVGNAIKFTEHGEVCLDVSLTQIANARARLQFSIRDTGIGIPLDQQEGLFQAFQQAHTSGARLYGGTGLGLALSRSIVTLMGGAITLASMPGEGTTITFDALFDLSPATQPALPLARADELQGLPTLVVDDNGTNRRILSELLQQWKMEPRLCDSGESGLAELLRAASAAAPYRLLLLDEQMPGMDGMQVLHRIRQNPLLQSVVIMMLSSHDQVRSAARCRQMGVETYLVKPIGPSDLLRSIRLAMAGRPQASMAALPVAAVPASPRSLRILLAEDNVVNQKVAMAMLSRMGHQVTLAANGRQALEQWRQGEFDLILMDVQLPGMSGLDATRQIRGEEPTGVHIPIVAMTASAMSEERERCLSAGMDDFLSKPVSYKTMEQMINAAARRP